MATKYLIKLWLLTLLLAPFIYGIYTYFKDLTGQVVTLIEVFPVTIIFSFLMSLPTFIVALVANRVTSNQNFPSWILKAINISIALIGIPITLLLIKGSLIPTLIPTYIISLLISASLLEIYSQFRKNRTEK